MPESLHANTRNSTIKAAPTKIVWKSVEKLLILACFCDYTFSASFQKALFTCSRGETCSQSLFNYTLLLKFVFHYYGNSWQMAFKNKFRIFSVFIVALKFSSFAVVKEGNNYFTMCFWDCREVHYF